MRKKLKMSGSAGDQNHCSTGRAYIKYFTGLLLFSSNGVIASAISLSSYQIVLLRSVIGAAFLLILFFSSGKRLNVRRYPKDFIFIALSGVAMAADWFFLFEAYATVGVSLGMLINYCGPAIVIALSPVILKERLTLPKLAALMSALVGACLISGQAAADGVRLWGLFCAVMSAAAYAAMVLTNKLAKSVSGAENAAVQLLATAVTAAVFVGLKQGFTVRIQTGDWLPILWLGLVNTGMGVYFYFSSMGSLSAQSVAVCGYIEPLMAVLLSAVILKEKMSPWQIAGAVLIIGGALYGELSGIRNVCKSKEKNI